MEAGTEAERQALLEQLSTKHPFSQLVLPSGEREITLVPRQALETLAAAMKDPLYGGIVQLVLKAAVGDAASDIIARKPANLHLALQFMAAAAGHSLTLYKAEHPELFPNGEPSRELLNAIVAHHKNVQAGNIELVDGRFETSKEMGEAQVRFADRMLGALPPDVQVILSALNYASFTSKTMLPGAQLLRDQDGSLAKWLAWTEQNGFQSMPHLVLSNLAMGSLFRGLLSECTVPQIKVIDMGAGSGSTTAALLLGYLDAHSKGSTSSLDVHLIEPSPPMFGTLKGEFLEAVSAKLAPPGNPTSWNINADVSDPTNSLRTHCVSLQDGLPQLLAGHAREIPVIATANYVFHRIPSAHKAEILRTLADASEDVVLFIADLEKNGSTVNRRHFNLGTNGLCNCGNIGLREQLVAAGFTVVEINPKSPPLGMDAKLAARIAVGTTEDSIFYIAVKGEKFTDLVTH